MLGHEPATADAGFRVALAGEHAFDEFHARPYAARVLPAAAGTAEPFAQQRAGQDQPTLVLLQLTGQRRGLAGGTHADADQRGQERRRDRQTRALGNVVDAGRNFQTATRPDHARQQVGETLARTFDARRHNARGDDRRLQQAEVVLRKVEYLSQVGDVRCRPQVNADQAEQRLFDHPQVGLDGRARRRVAPVYAQVNGDVEHFGPLGEIHAQEEDVAPAAMREVHAHWRALTQNRVGAVERVSPEQFRPQAQGVIGRVPHAKHPLVAAHRPHTASDLVSQRLERQPVVGRRQGTRDSVAGTLRSLHRQKVVNGLFESALQQVLVALEGNERP